MQVEVARAAARAPVLGTVARVLARRAPSQQADLRAPSARDAAQCLDDEGYQERVVRRGAGRCTTLFAFYLRRYLLAPEEIDR